MNSRIIFTSCYRGVESESEGYQIFRKTKRLPNNIDSYMVTDMSYTKPRAFNSNNVDDFPKAYSYRKAENGYVYTFNTYVGKDVLSERIGNFITDFIISDNTKIPQLISLDLSKLHLNNNEAKEYANNKQVPNYFENEDITSINDLKFIESNYGIISKAIKENLTEEEFKLAFAIILEAINTKSQVSFKFAKSEVLLYLYMLAVRFNEKSNEISVTTYKENSDLDFMISGYYNLANSKRHKYFYNQTTNETNYTLNDNMSLFLSTFYNNMLDDFSKYMDLTDFILKNKIDVISDPNLLVMYTTYCGININDATRFIKIYDAYSTKPQNESLSELFGSKNFIDIVSFTEKVVSSVDEMKIIFSDLDKMKLSIEEKIAFLIKVYKKYPKHFAILKDIINNDDLYLKYVLLNPKMYYHISAINPLIVKFITNNKQVIDTLVINNRQLVTLLNKNPEYPVYDKYKDVLSNLELFKLLVLTQKDYNNIEFIILAEKVKALEFLANNSKDEDVIYKYLDEKIINQDSGVLAYEILKNLSAKENSIFSKDAFITHLLNSIKSFEECDAEMLTYLSGYVMKVDKDSLDTSLLIKLVNSKKLSDEIRSEIIIRRIKAKNIDVYNKLINSETFKFKKSYALPMATALIKEEMKFEEVVNYINDKKLTDEFKMEFIRVLQREKAEEIVEKLKTDYKDEFTGFKVDSKQFSEAFNSHIKKGLFGIKLLTSLEELNSFIELSDLSCFSENQVDLLMKFYEKNSYKQPLKLEYLNILYHNIKPKKGILDSVPMKTQLFSAFTDFLNKFKINLYEASFDYKFILKNKYGIFTKDVEINLEEDKLINAKQFNKDILNVSKEDLYEFVLKNLRANEYDINFKLVVLEKIIEKSKMEDYNEIFKLIADLLLHESLNVESDYKKLSEAIIKILSNVERVDYDNNEINNILLLMLSIIQCKLLDAKRLIFTRHPKFSDLNKEYIGLYLQFTLLGGIPDES